MLNIPLSEKGIVPKTFFVAINGEIFVNLSKKVVYNTFDQNRFFAGLSYQTGVHSNIQLGFMRVYQQLGAGNRYRSTDAIRLFYFQNLDIRKNKKTH